MLRLSFVACFVFLLALQSSGMCADLVAAWSFEEGSGDIVKDVSGNGHDGVISGAEWVDGKMGKALKFNGDGDQVLIEHNNALNIQGELTVEAWVFPVAWNSDLNAIAQKWEDDSGRRQYQLTVYQEKCRWYLSDTGANWPCTLGAETIPLGEWTHIAGTYDGKKLRNYINGKFDAELDQPNGIFASDVPVAIGGYGPKTPQCTYGENRHFNGIIDEVRFWDGVLTEDEIKVEMGKSVALVHPLGKCATTWAQVKESL